MKNKTESFSTLLHSFGLSYNLFTVFDDFLTMTLCSFSQNPGTGKSYDEDLYLQTIDKYKESPLRYNFPKMLNSLVNEMETRFEGDTGWDVLGEFYEQNLSKKGASQFFTPWPICTFMAKSSFDAAVKTSPGKSLKILEPACGSGRMLLACKKVAGPYHDYNAIDIDLTCVKMTAINLFLSGMFHSEVMCSNALLPDTFNCSYKISFLPFGVFRILDKNQSRLWTTLKELENDRIKGKEKAPLNFDPIADGEVFSKGEQLKFF
jgi:type I restriction-modification system DNA methylase subunit